MIDETGLPYRIRKPDFIVGHPDNPYLHRWWIIPRNRFFNIYLHHFLRSDDDRALHDHPWWNCSFLLKGSYKEHMPIDPVRWEVYGERTTFYKVRPRFSFVFRGAEAIHRVELFKEERSTTYEEYKRLQGNPWRITVEKPVWTLFITGPRVREWVFWCPKGWVWFKNFVSLTDNVSDIGKGCDQ